MNELETINDELLAAMTGPAEGAVSAGSPPTLHEIIHRGDESFEAPLVAKVYSDAGVVPIYDTRTGERSLTNRNMLKAQLEKKREDGTRVFSTRKPDIAVVRGSHLCMLHSERPERGHFDELGLPTCRKSNLLSEHQVKSHMQHRHRVEWQTIEEERLRKEREEERALQRAILQSTAAAVRETETRGVGRPRRQELVEAG